MNCVTTAKGVPTMASSPGSPLSPLTVEQEYNNSLRTKSFLNIWKIADHHIKKTTSTAASLDVEPENCRSTHYYAHLLDSLLDPGQETLLAAASDTNCKGHRRLHRLLLQYLNATMDACIACTSLLSSIDLMYTHHRTLRRLVHQLGNRPNRRSISQLSNHLQLDNPFSATNLKDFYHVHSLYSPLIYSLASARLGIRRRKMIIKAAKYVGAALCSAAALAAVLLVMHSVVGIAFFPLAAVLLPRLARRRVAGCGHEQAVRQVDAAAKGAYIVGRDFDTLSRMVKRLHDEMEHQREVGLMAVRNCKERKIVMEVAREMESEVRGFGEQLAELEEHVYLCLLITNKCRKLVVLAIGGAARTTPTEAMA